jgi:hypothetical protein
MFVKKSKKINRLKNRRCDPMAPLAKPIEREEIEQNMVSIERAWDYIFNWCEKNFGYISEKESEKILNKVRSKNESSD